MDIWKTIVAAFKDPKTTAFGILVLAFQFCKLFGLPVDPAVWNSLSILAGAALAVSHGGIKQLSTTVGGVLSAIFMLLETWHITHMTPEQITGTISLIVAVMGFLGFSKGDSTDASSLSVGDPTKTGA